MEQRLNDVMRRHGMRIHFCFGLLLSYMIHFRFVVTPNADELSSFSPLPISAVTWDALYEWISSFLQKAGREIGLYQLSSENFQQYGTVQTIWLFVIRLIPMMAFPILCSQVMSLVVAESPPGLEKDLAELSKIEKSNGKMETPRPKVHCMCVRLITRGDEGARGLIKDSIDAAVAVLNNYLDCQHLKVHIVTQTKFLTEVQRKQWIAMGATEVREIFVPPSYRSPRGTLFKARNIQFWTESGGVGSDCEESASWVLSLDEEAVVFPSLIRSFIRNVLESPDASKIGYALSPAVIDVNSGHVPLAMKLMEAKYMAFSWCNTQCRTEGVQDSLLFHGGAFFVRANVDKLVGNDWGPKISVAEDFATGLVSAHKKIGCKYLLDGRFIEGPASSFGIYIRQRTRVLKGQLYALFLLDVSFWQKIRSAWFLIVIYLFPLVRFFCALLALSPWMYPAGPRCLLFDIPLIIALAIQSTSYVFGASCMNLSGREMVRMTVGATVMVLGFDSVIDTAVLVAGAWQMFKEHRSGQVTFELTQKRP